MPIGQEASEVNRMGGILFTETFHSLKHELLQLDGVSGREEKKCHSYDSIYDEQLRPFQPVALPI